MFKLIIIDKKSNKIHKADKYSVNMDLILNCNFQK